MDKKRMTCCFTGHRDIAAAQYEHIHKRLEAEIVSLIEQGVVYFGAGAARGFDTLAAQTVLALKRQYTQIKLILVIPCINHTKGWRQKDIDQFQAVKAECDKFIYTAQEYTRDCMLKRNRHLVAHSGYCICYLVHQTGGTAYTVNYAKQQGLQVVNIAEE